jgi:NAD(P)-dependent dehydrogenase (short-subunit alcohol dehydrogenase family)
MIVVTGGAGALGSAVVKLLCARGEKVAAVDVEAASSRLDALGRETGCVTAAMDVAREDAWPELLAHRPTGAVLVAGGWAGGCALHEGDSSFERMLAMNTDTAYRSLRALLPGMVERKRGSIVIIGSRAVERPWESANAAAYAASKSAVVALAQAVAAEVLSHSVRVNAVLPSTIDTEANRSAMPDADASAWVTTESVARVIAFLLSDDSRDVSGAAIPVYGRVR